MSPRICFHRRGGRARWPVIPSLRSRRTRMSDMLLDPFYDLKRDGWDIQVKTETVMTSTKSDLVLTGRLDAFEDGKRVVSRDWRETVPRNCL